TVNQNGDAGQSMLRDGRISTLNSARWSESPSEWNEGQPELLVPAGLAMSGREDSNLRPPEPHSGALAKLRHAPKPSPAGTRAYLLSRSLPIFKTALLLRTAQIMR